MESIIQTKRGNVNIKDIIPGDQVYEFNTGMLYNVITTVENHNVDHFKITLSDGRYGIYALNELINLDGNYIPIHHIANNLDDVNSVEIIHKGIEYNRLSTTLRPDPYMAGALLVNGDQDDEYVNLPSSQLAANYQFSTMYGVEYGEKVGSGIMYYSNNYQDKSDLLDWNCMFPHYDIYCKDNRFDKIPIEYMRAHMNDRWQFIRGAFDIGYFSDTFPDSLGIANANKDVLTLVQNMLLSMGILSRIEYEDVSIPSKPYHLIVVGKYDKYPAIFYNYSAIKDMILHNRVMVNRHESFKLTISEVEKIDSMTSCSLMLTHPRVSYMTDNFMPKVSI